MQSTTTFEFPGFQTYMSRRCSRHHGADAIFANDHCRSLAHFIRWACRYFRNPLRIGAEAFQLMLAHAREKGANAVVGIRYDTGPMVGAAEVLCYGTAVVVEPSGT
jgi:uncharacterized protein YbjQ (UPF0145 family)